LLLRERKLGFANDGLVQRRIASINNLPIQERDRKFNWDSSGPRPADHPGLSDLDLRGGSGDRHELKCHAPKVRYAPTRSAPANRRALIVSIALVVAGLSAERALSELHQADLGASIKQAPHISTPAGAYRCEAGNSFPPRGDTVSQAPCVAYPVFSASASYSLASASARIVRA
jgi:hypothetical protein